MKNEQILNERWENIDKYLSIYLKKYNDINQVLKDRLQDLFNSIEITYSEIRKTISKTQINILNRFIGELKKDGLLSGYYGYKAKALLNKKNITYSEMLEVIISGLYIQFNSELIKENEDLFYKTCKTSYESGMNDIVKTRNIKPISFKIPILYTLLNIPVLDVNINTYLESLALTNANETYKQTLINLQLKKELNINSNFYKELISKQNNRYVCVNDDHLSGGIVDIVENLSNKAYLQAGLDTNTQQCRFIAEMDKKTTRMCNSLNNKLFYISEMNEYDRYSEIDKKIVRYHTMGLVTGENLPPINNHFHWCRSTITYLLDITSEEFNK